MPVLWYFACCLDPWSQYSGQKKRRLPYFLTFFLLMLVAQYKPPYFNAEFLWRIVSWTEVYFHCPEFHSYFWDSFASISCYVICKSHIDTNWADEPTVALTVLLPFKKVPNTDKWTLVCCFMWSMGVHIVFFPIKCPLTLCPNSTRNRGQLKTPCT